MNIDKFWKDFLHTNHLSSDSTYLESFHFDTHEQSANKLLQLVLQGKKKATASSFAYYEVSGNRLPQKGDYSIVTDWDGKPSCVIETTNVILLPFKDMTLEICSREGEDDSLHSWQDHHIEFFTIEGNREGYKFSEDMLVVFEDFKVVYQAS